MLIFGWAAWRYGFVPERFQRAALLVGQAFQSTLGLGLSRQDAFDRPGGIRAVADGTFQGGEPVGPRVAAQQPQHASGLILAAALITQQAIEETPGRRTQFAETFTQQRQLLRRVLLGPMGRVHALLLGDTRREQTMARHLGDGGTVDDDLGSGDTERQGLADELPGNRVVILLIADEALDIGDAVKDLGRIVGLCRQGHQVRLLLGVTVDGPLFRLAVDLNVSHVGQPPGRDRVELRQVPEGPAVEQVLLDKVERALDASLGLSCQLHPIWTVPTELFGSPIPFTLSTVVSSPW